MRQLFGVGGHNIDFVSNALSRFAEHNEYSIKILGIDTRLNKPTDKNIILLVPTVGGIRRNWQMLNESPNVIPICFDCPLQLSELHPIVLMDVEKNSPSYLFRYRKLEPNQVVEYVRKAIKQNKQVVVKRKTIDVCLKLLKQTYGSVIAKLISFLYSVPDTNKRVELQNTIFTHMWNNKVEELKSLLGKKYSSSTAKEFIEYLDDSVTKNTILALQDIKESKSKSKAIAYEKISKKHGVSKFDLKYFMKHKLSTKL